MQPAAARSVEPASGADGAPTLAVNKRRLKGDDEMKRIFGASVLADEARGGQLVPALHAQSDIDRGASVQASALDRRDGVPS